LLNDNLDLAHWRDRLQRNGRIQIPDVLQASAVEHLRRCLTEEVPWTLAMRDAAGQSRVIAHAQLQRLDAAGQSELLRQAAEDAADRYGFAYESYMMVTAYLEQRDPDLLLHRILEFLNSPDFLGFARTLTGDSAIGRVSAQATRYRPGMFLKMHNAWSRPRGAAMPLCSTWVRPGQPTGAACCSSSTKSATWSIRSCHSPIPPACSRCPRGTACRWSHPGLGRSDWRSPAGGRIERQPARAGRRLAAAYRSALDPRRLTQSDPGIATREVVERAKLAAAVVLMCDGLDAIPALPNPVCPTHRVLRQSLLGTVLWNLLLVLVAMRGSISAAMKTSTLAVGLGTQCLRMLGRAALPQPTHRRRKRKYHGRSAEAGVTSCVFRSCACCCSPVPPWRHRR